MAESTNADEELRQRWLAWARRNHLGSEPQLLAAAGAAVEAASRGATSEDAARAAREAVAVIPISTSGGRPNQNQANAASQPELSPGGITWEMAMDNAGKILTSFPMLEKSGQLVRWSTTYMTAASLAQAWIAFARELTMHGRVIR